MDNKKSWHEQHEKILKEWGESCACYRYLHFKAYKKYKKSTMRFTLPIIIISTITGTANFAQETFPKSIRPYVPAIIGGFNLFGAILTTISQFLKVNELMESHRVSSIHYGKLARSIRLELNLPRYERTHDGNGMVDMCKTEYDRLIEQSPNIPGIILSEFDETFKTNTITKPDITNVTIIDPFDNNHEELITRDVAIKFKENLKNSKQPMKKSKTLLEELKELRNRNLVSGDKFYDCELAEPMNNK